jgi:hypothetical protein
MINGGNCSNIHAHNDWNVIPTPIQQTVCMIWNACDAIITLFIGSLVLELQGPPSLLYSGYRVFPGGKDGRGVMLTTHPLLVLRLRKSWAIAPLTQWVLLGLLWGSLYLVLESIWSSRWYEDRIKWSDIIIIIIIIHSHFFDPPSYPKAFDMKLVK